MQKGGDERLEHKGTGWASFGGGTDWYNSERDIFIEIHYGVGEKPLASEIPWNPQG